MRGGYLITRNSTRIDKDGYTPTGKKDILTMNDVPNEVNDRVTWDQRNFYDESTFEAWLKSWPRWQDIPEPHGKGSIPNYVRNYFEYEKIDYDSSDDEIRWSDMEDYEIKKLKKGELQQIDSKGDSLLVYLIKNNKVDLIKDIIKKEGVDLNERKELLLRWALQNNHDEIVEYIIKKGKVDVNTLNKKPLYIAIENGSINNVKSLLKSKAKLIPGHLQLAIKKGDLEMIRWLISKIQPTSEMINIPLKRVLDEEEYYAIVMELIDSMNGRQDFNQQQFNMAIETENFGILHSMVEKSKQQPNWVDLLKYASGLNLSKNILEYIASKIDKSELSTILQSALFYKDKNLLSVLGPRNITLPETAWHLTRPNSDDESE
jgi:hypothetical protein